MYCHLKDFFFIIAFISHTISFVVNGTPRPKVMTSPFSSKQALTMTGSIYRCNSLNLATAIVSGRTVNADNIAAASSLGKP